MNTLLTRGEGSLPNLDLRWPALRKERIVLVRDAPQRPGCYPPQEDLRPPEFAQTITIAVVIADRFWRLGLFLSLPDNMH